MKSLLPLIHEINLLWEPVFPYLARHIIELYGRTDGHVVDIGPFGGVIFDLIKRTAGHSFSIATFPPGMGEFYLTESKQRGVGSRLNILETNPSLTDLKDDSIDLAVFRGAFFFPSLFEVNLTRIFQTLAPGGMAFVGGGFGKYTPEDIIRDIGRKSRDLNLQIGKVEINPDALRKDIDALGLKGRIDVLTEGGLWTVMKKDGRRK